MVATIGAATAFFAATIGLVQTDIKRVLAYSTVSQLGYMFLALGVGAVGLRAMRGAIRGSRVLKRRVTIAPMLRFDIFTLFPAMFTGPFDESIIKRARERRLIEVEIHDIREWTHDRHHTLPIFKGIRLGDQST